ncbi:MAG: glycoside hydrolase family 55 protein [Anaeroplasmataceae bacterium]|nr:glycoside hydrolase family 55 protein [Anaeroplasmataceae bacterium]
MKKLVFLVFLFPLLFACGQNLKEIPISSNLEEAYHTLELPLEIEENITLPLMINQVQIQWNSTNETILSSTGVVQRGQENETVTLTACLSLNEETKIKEFYITVLALPRGTENINHTINYDYKMSQAVAEEYPYYKGYLYPGLLNKDGSEHTDFKENETIGKRINVRLFGAKADDPAFDNTLAFQNAIASAQFGDEIYVPKGKYYFSSATITQPYYAHIKLKEGINLIGEGKSSSILVSNFKNKEYVDKSLGKKTATLVCGNMSNSTISNLGFSANTDDSCLPKDINDTKVNNPEGNQYAPAFGIVVYNTSSATLTQNIYIHDVYIEYFQYDGIRLFCTRDCKIADCVITKSTDLGGGGAGYGIEIRGYGHEYYKYIDTNLDSCYNIVTGVKVIGPYIRHGIILSYLTHNNLFYNNEVTDSADDAFDVHGQDEFLNVFVQNYGKGSRRGAGLGLGNTGSTHDESGYGNVIYENTFVECRYGITIARGTTYTQVIRNKIEACQYGIYINDGPNTYQENNQIK